MVQNCKFFNCREEQKTGSNISFHRFPRDITLKKQWILATGRENFEPTRNARICSKHFNPDSFNTSPWSSKNSLKNDAVPNNFDCPDPLVVKHENLETETNKETNEETSTEPSLAPPAKNKRLSVVNHENLETETNEETSTEPSLAPPAKKKRLLVVKHENLETETNKETTEETSTEPSLEPFAKKKRLYYFGDFKDYEGYDLAVKRQLLKKNNQIKLLKQQNRRLTKKVCDLQSLLLDLRQKDMIDEEASLQLLDTMSASTKKIFEQLLKTKRSKYYPPDLKTFILTLNFYSPRAYLYARKTFPNMLPDPKTLQKWYENVSPGSGFQENPLMQKVLQLRDQGKPCICSLMIDKMELHNEI